MMEKFRSWIMVQFSGRYGTDRLGKALLWATVALAAINIFASSIVLYGIQTALLMWALFRFLSRDHARRVAENAAFEHLLQSTKTFFKLRRSMMRDRKTHVFRRCPHCKAMLRLPRSKGHHTVRCPRCSNRFELDI